MPDLAGCARDYRAAKEEKDSGNHDFPRSEAVGSHTAEWSEHRAHYAGEGVAQGDGRRAPAHVMLKGNYQHSEGLTHRASGHVHESRDGDDYPGVMNAGENFGYAAALII